MEYRFSLDENFDADLIERIKEKANGSSQNKAIKFLVRYWFEAENNQFLPPKRQISDSQPPVERQDESEDIADVLSAINQEW